MLLSWTASTSTGIFMDRYGYFFLLGDIYIYISQKKLYVQQLGFIRASLEMECAGGEAQSTAVTSP